MIEDETHQHTKNVLRKHFLEYEAIRLDKIAADLNMLRMKRICAYGADEVNSDGRPFLCDCKYGGPSIQAGTEQTGCPEMRAIIWSMRKAAREARYEVKEIEKIGSKVGSGEYVIGLDSNL